MDEQVEDLGSPSKLSRKQQQRRPRINDDNKLTIRTSKTTTQQVKMSVALFILSIYAGLYFEETSKLVRSYLQPYIGEIEAEVDESREIVTTSSTINDNNINNNNNKHVTTLALLYPPGMMGGYRNQVLRLIAFMVYAKENNITQILLPSVLFTTKLLIHDPGSFNTNLLGNNNNVNNNDATTTLLSLRDFPIPFDWIFDVDHWNTYHDHLPILVTPDRMILSSSSSSHSSSDCWIESSEIRDIYQLHNATRHTDHNVQNLSNIFYYKYSASNKNNNESDSTTRSNTVSYVNHLQRAVLLQGMIRPIAENITIPILTNQLTTFNPRLHNFAPYTERCINPRVHGGGKKAGVLWNAYVSYQKNAATKDTRSNNKSFVPFDTDIWIYKALQPSEMWRTVAKECIDAHAASGKYIALHARVELEMMEHICGSGMEKNLSKIVNQVHQLYNNQSEIMKSSISALFVAVSRNGMEPTNNQRNTWLGPISIENIQTLDRIIHGSSNASVLPAFECGEKVLQQFYNKNPNIPNHGTLLQSVINFYIAVSSEIFIGVAQSSYSTDILTTRHWLGKGSSNYRYTPEGIEPVENGGLPVPHSNCQRSRPGPKRRHAPKNIPTEKQ